MARPKDFREAYPLSAKAALHTPLVFRAGLESLKSLPWPSLEGLQDFARFARIGEGALRTALSRAKAEGSLLVEADEEGVRRFRLSETQFALGTALIHQERRPEGFLLAIFSFTSEDGQARAALRDLLKDCGFRKLAQNTYINGRIDVGPLKQAVAGLGLSDHLFLFTCPEPEDPDLMARILGLFDLKSRKKELDAYLACLKAFLPEGLSPDEEARRLLYVGPVHYERLEVGEPPIPSRHLPPGYALGEIQAFYGRRLEAGFGRMAAYYAAVNGGRK